LAPILLSLTLSTGCVVHRHYDGDYGRGGPGPQANRGYGPPPHAPAHGYRAKQHGRDLEFDAHLGVYLVLGLPGVYWNDGWFYRRLRDRWQRCGDGDGPWHDARWGDIPIGLRGGDRDRDRDRDRGNDDWDGGKSKSKSKSKDKGYR